MKRPSFQFYTADWQGNSNLKRCTHEEKGIWIDILCLLHDQEEYGILRWPLKEIAQAVGASLSKVKSLSSKGVIKGSDSGCESYIYTPRSGRKDGNPVILIPKQDGIIWYSSRMVRDEYVRQNAGASTRFQAKTDNNSRPTSKNNDNERTKLRQKVLSKTEGKCFHCKCELSEYWEIDHLVPRSKGGSHSFDNLVPSCEGCNQDKSDTMPEDWRSPYHSPSHGAGDSKGDGSTSSSTSSSTKKGKREQEDRTEGATRFTLAALPEDWKSFCLEERPELIPETVFKKFAIHFKNKSSNDWFAAWKKWVIDERSTGVISPEDEVVNPQMDGWIKHHKNGGMLADFAITALVNKFGEEWREKV